MRRQVRPWLTPLPGPLPVTPSITLVRLMTRALPLGLWEHVFLFSIGIPQRQGFLTFCLPLRSVGFSSLWVVVGTVTQHVGAQWGLLGSGGHVRKAAAWAVVRIK